MIREIPDLSSIRSIDNLLIMPLLLNHDRPTGRLVAASLDNRTSLYGTLDTQVDMFGIENRRVTHGSLGMEVCDGAIKVRVCWLLTGTAFNQGRLSAIIGQEIGAGEPRFDQRNRAVRLGDDRVGSFGHLGRKMIADIGFGGGTTFKSLGSDTEDIGTC